jgi:hypothetical protein
MFYDQPSNLWATLESAFRAEIIFQWTVMFHVAAVAGALFATVVALWPGVQRRGWIVYFSVAYWSGLLYYLIAGQLQCSICVQAYLNYADYLAAIAAGLAFQAIVFHAALRPLAVWIGTIAFAVLGMFIVVQSLHLRGVYALPTAMKVSIPLPQQVERVKVAVKNIIPQGDEIAVIASDRRILLGLTEAGVRFPPWTLISPFNYRRIQDGLDPEVRDQTAREIEDISDWTDSTARRWLSQTYDWLLVQYQPEMRQADWVIWHPKSSLVVGALERCFVRERVYEIADIDPMLKFMLYRRSGSGPMCVDIAGGQN